MAKRLATLGTYLFRSIRQPGQTKILYQNTDGAWKEKKSRGVILDPVTPLAKQKFAQLGGSRISIYPLSQIEGSLEAEDFYELRTFDDSVVSLNSDESVIDSSGTRILYFNERFFSLLDIPSGRIVRSSFEMKEAKKMRLIQDRFLLWSLDGVMTISWFPKKLRDLPMTNRVFGSTRDMFCLTSGDVKILEEKYLIFLDTSDQRGIGILSLEEIERCLRKGEHPTPVFVPDSEEMRTFDVLRLEGDRFVVGVGDSNEGKVWKMLWFMDLRDLEKCLSGGANDKGNNVTSLRAERTESGHFDTSDIPRIWKNKHPFAHYVEDIQPLELLTLQKPELRKETQRFLAETVLTVPVDVLDIVSKFLV